jgi:hypothetical protein
VSDAGTPAEYTNCILCGRDVPPWTDPGDDHAEGWLASSPAVCAKCKDVQATRIDPFGEIPEGTICRNCKEHPATVRWFGNASVMDANHGAPVFAWCGCCALKAQLAYAEAQAAHLSSLRVQLEHPCAEIRLGEEVP